MDVLYSSQEIVWEDQSIPLKPVQADETHFYIKDDSEAVQEVTKRMKTILDAKYEKADLTKIVQQQHHSNVEHQQKLYKLLKKYEILFDGTLGTLKDHAYNVELKKGVKPYHAKPYPIPKCYEDTFKMEVNRLVQLGVLKKVNRSRWTAPTFLIPKADKTVRFISDFRELNKRIQRKPFPLPKIQDLLMKLEGFTYATTLDLNMGYYHIELTPFSKQLCTIVLPWENMSIRSYQWDSVIVQTFFKKR